MFTNYNIWKYCAKYFFLLTLGAYVYNTCKNLINQKSDIANLLGTALFAGLFMSWLLFLKSDVTKLVSNIKENKNKNKQE